MLKSNTFIKNIAIYLIAFGAFLCISFGISAIDPDTYWNFHFIQKLYNGYLPYKDFNIIIPPLFHYIGTFFMAFLGNKFYTMYFYAAFCSAITLFLCSKIVKLYYDSFWSRFTALSLFTTFILAYNYSANYNTLMIIFPFLIILIEHKIASSNKTRKYRCLEGICLGLMVLTKHTIGGIFSFVFYLYLLIISPQKNKLKSILPVLLFEFAVGIVFVCYLLSNSIFVDFINYCIGGIFDFSEKNTAFTVASLLPIVFCFILTLPLVFHYKKEKDNFDLLYVLFFLASIFIVYPLANTPHIMIALFVISSVVMYSLKVFFKDVTLSKEGKKSVIFTRTIIIINFIAYLIFYASYASFYNYYDIDKEFEVYKYCNFADKYFEADLRNISLLKKQKEKEGYNVYILSSNASLYGIPCSTNNGVLDLILNGNLGYNGTQNVIDKISKIENPYFLKLDQGVICFQESKEVEDFIVNNYTYCNERYNEMRVFVSK